jgi:hypothetical protein
MKQQAKVILNHENANFGNIGQGEARHKNYKGFELGGDDVYDRSVD